MNRIFVEQNTRIQPVEKMVAEVYGRIDLGDPRRENRLLQLATELVKNPGKNFGQIFGEWKDVKGAYRLIENPEIDSHELLKPLEEAGAKCCMGQDRVFAVQDTTTLDFSHRQALEGLGPIHTSANPRQGMLLHSTLAFDESGTPIGFLGIQSWARDPAAMGKRASRRNLPIEEKESSKWIVGMEKAQENLDAFACKVRPPYVIHVMDREGDIFEVFEKASELGHGLVVRAAWNRSVEGEEEYLWETMKSCPLGGQFTVAVSAKPKQAARTAHVEIRWNGVTVKPPRPRRKGKTPIAVKVVWVLEPNPPEGANPVEWMLLTTEEITRFESAMEIVQIYRHRWRVEELHLILKSGCRIEQGQFASGENIKKLLALYLLSALRILTIRYLAETQPEASANQVLDEEEQESLRIYVRKHFNHKIQGVLTVGEVQFWIGRIGGHLGRKRDGRPGVRTLWRGWRDFELIVSMYIALNHD